MKKQGWILQTGFFLWCSMNQQLAAAAQIKVEKTRGNRAIVSVPVGTKLSPGDRLYVESDSFEDLGSDPTGGSRTHRFSWQYDSGKTSTALDSATSDSTTGTLSFGYMYNFGRFEAGPAVLSTISQSGSYSETNSIIAITGKLNIIENLPSNPFIPYLLIGAGSMIVSGKSGARSLDGTGSASMLELGLDWFPNTSNFAVNFGYYNLSQSFNVTSLSDSTVKVTRSALRVGWSIYFQ